MVVRTDGMIARPRARRAGARPYVRIYYWNRDYVEEES